MKLFKRKSVNEKRHYMVLSTRYTKDGFLQFTGDNEASYTNDLKKAKRYTDSDIMQFTFPKYPFLTSEDKIENFNFRNDHFIIHVNILPRIARLRYAKINCDGTVTYRLQIKPELYNLKRNKKIEDAKNEQM